MKRAVFTDLRLALAKLQDDTIAATVCEQEDWRAESFIDTLRGIRHVKQLVDEAERERERERECAARRDLETLKQAAAQRDGAQ